MKNTIETTTSIGINRWSHGQKLTRLWSRGAGDARLTGWQREDGQLAIETNGEPIFESEDGFEEAWSAVDDTSEETHPAVAPFKFHVTYRGRPVVEGTYFDHETAPLLVFGKYAAEMGGFDFWTRVLIAKSASWLFEDRQMREAYACEGLFTVVAGEAGEDLW